MVFRSIAREVLQARVNMLSAECSNTGEMHGDTMSGGLARQPGNELYVVTH